MKRTLFILAVVSTGFSLLAGCSGQQESPAQAPLSRLQAKQKIESSALPPEAKAAATAEAARAAARERARAAQQPAPATR
jgi:hypothetical protein